MLRLLYENRCRSFFHLFLLYTGLLLAPLWADTDGEAQLSAEEAQKRARVGNGILTGSMVDHMMKAQTARSQKDFSKALDEDTKALQLVRQMHKNMDSMDENKKREKRASDTSDAAQQQLSQELKARLSSTDPVQPKATFERIPSAAELSKPKETRSLVNDDTQPHVTSADLIGPPKESVTTEKKEEAPHSEGPELTQEAAQGSTEKALSASASPGPKPTSPEMDTVLKELGQVEETHSQAAKEQGTAEAPTAAPVKEVSPPALQRKPLPLLKPLNTVAIQSSEAENRGFWNSIGEEPTDKKMKKNKKRKRASPPLKRLKVRAKIDRETASSDD